MNESSFHQLIDDTFEQIEEILDDAESDLDYENSGGVLTVICESGARVIFTRQTPVSQLWIATPHGGFHFDYDSDSACWQRDSDQTPLAQFLSETFQQVAGEPFDFSAL